MRPMKIGPARKLLLRPRKSVPAVTMKKEKRRGERRPVLPARTFQKERPRHRVESIEQITEHRARRELARVEFRIAMNDVQFTAHARFIFPPEMTGIAAAQIDDGLYSVRPQKSRQKAGIGLCRARSLAGFDPVKVVRQVQKHVDATSVQTGQLRCRIQPRSDFFRRQTRLLRLQNAESLRPAQNHAKWPCGKEASPRDRKS